MPVRRRFGIRRKISDATLRDALAYCRSILHSVTSSEIRGKSVAVDFDLPFGVVSMDGKYVKVPSVDDQKSDDDPWVLRNPRLTATIMVLRRIGYSLLTIFRSVTQRSDHQNP